MDAFRSLLRPGVTGALLVLLLAGCSSDEEQATLSVTYDGAACSYNGPSEVVAGDVEIEAVNDSETYTEVGIALIDESSTFEAFVDFYQPEPEVVDSPDFATPIGSVPAEPGETESDSFTLGGGQYALVCLILVSDEPPPGVWVAQPGGVTVTE